MNPKAPLRRSMEEVDLLGQLLRRHRAVGDWSLGSATVSFTAQHNIHNTPRHSQCNTTFTIRHNISTIQHNDDVHNIVIVIAIAVVIAIAIVLQCYCRPTFCRFLGLRFQLDVSLEFLLFFIGNRLSTFKLTA